MAFVTDKEELKPGLIIFRRADVDHRNWYCRVKLPKVDRYKTVSLKTSDLNAARERAFDHDADIRFRLKHDVPVFNRPFSKVAEEYVAQQEHRAKAGEITDLRVKKLKSVIRARLNPYVGPTQIHLVTQDRWENFPAWRRANGQGRMARPGQTRTMTEEETAEARATEEAKAKAKARVVAIRSPRSRKAVNENSPIATKASDQWIIVSDATIRFEMSIFEAIMNFAVSKRYVPASQRFEGRPKFKKMRRDEFTLEEYRKLHTVGRSWMKRADRRVSAYAEMARLYR